MTNLTIGNSELIMFLNEIEACDSSIEWLQDRNSEQMWNDCPRGDWMLWLLHKLNINKRTFTLCKGKCAETVKHLMKDDRSRNAVEVVVRYGNGEATDKELEAAASAYDATYAAAASASAYAAKKENQQQTADIVRRIVSHEQLLQLIKDYGKC